MAKDKKCYQATIDALMTQGTYAGIINKLNKVYVDTEDADLKKALLAIICNLKEVASIKNKTISLSFNGPPYKQIIDYCENCIQSMKPEWQIIAEKHGWKPPN